MGRKASLTHVVGIGELIATLVTIQCYLNAKLKYCVQCIRLLLVSTLVLQHVQ